MIRKLWGDEEIGGRVSLKNWGVMQAVNFPEKEQKDAVWKVVFACMHKLTILKHHQKQYEQWERNKFVNAQARLKKSQRTRQEPEEYEEFEMIAELEAFLHQVKSSLDMLAKLLMHTANLGKGATSTFGDYGDRLGKKLRAGLLYKTEKKDLIEDLIKLIEDEQKTWLKFVVDLRDQISHWQGLSGLAFGYILVAGKLTPTYPTINGKRIPDFLKLIQENLIGFHQDFLALALRIKFFPGLELIPLDPAHGESKYNHSSGRFVKWGIGMKNLPAGTTSGV